MRRPSALVAACLLWAAVPPAAGNAQQPVAVDMVVRRRPAK